MTKLDISLAAQSSDHESQVLVITRKLEKQVFTKRNMFFTCKLQSRKHVFSLRVHDQFLNFFSPEFSQFFSATFYFMLVFMCSKKCTSPSNKSSQRFSKSSDQTIKHWFWYCVRKSHAWLCRDTCMKQLFS